MSRSRDGCWSGDPDRKRVWEETERARLTRERYWGSVEGIKARMADTHRKRDRRSHAGTA